MFCCISAFTKVPLIAVLHLINCCSSYAKTLLFGDFKLLFWMMSVCITGEKRIRDGSELFQKVKSCSSICPFVNIVTSRIV